jgi:hypothetical protein
MNRSAASPSSAVSTARLRRCVLTFGVALALLPATSNALAPALLFMVKQIAQQAATSMLKDALLSSLNGMGCKGIALTNAINTLDLRKGGGLGGVGAAAAVVPGMSMPGMPAGMSMSGMPGVPSALPPEFESAMRVRMPSVDQMPPGIVNDPRQAEMMARVQQSMAQPLTLPETLATIDDMTSLGFFPKAMQAEFKECLQLVPASVPAVGMAMGILKPMIPQLRQAREQLHALSPAEQDEVAAALVQEVQPMPAAQRTAFVEHLDSGFFPARIAAAVKRKLQP